MLAVFVIILAVFDNYISNRYNYVSSVCDHISNGW